MDHIGIDVHLGESQICILTEQGEWLERSVRTRRERFVAVLGARPRARILLEASTESEWVAQVLEELGHEVIVADPNYAPMYPERRRRVKTNRRDARMLAEACRLGAYRRAHRVSAARRAVRQQLTVREVLVRTRGRAINVIKALLRSEGWRVRSGAAERFVARLSALALPPALVTRLAPLVELLRAVETQLAMAEQALTARVAHDPLIERLRTTPGVGPITATAYVATVDDVERFGGAHQVASYLGLVPSEDSSAGYRRRGPITKAGDARMRWLLGQAAWALWRSRRAEARPLRAWADGIAHRRGRRIAIVALARRLAGILYALWRDGTTFDPARLGPRAAATGAR